MLIYGTAWKEERTEGCVSEALAAGFRAIDTANQRKHYFEAGVGAAIRASGIPRGELWLQTKFTHRDGQDDRLPYDPAAPIGVQVEQSFASSLEHLGTPYLDSLVLHGPSQRSGFSAEDLEVWRALEAIATRGGAKQIGVSNVTAAQLEELAKLATVRVACVQDRCYARNRWNADTRAVAKHYGITYQGFSLLTANRTALVRPVVDEIMARTGHTREQLVFAFARQLGMDPLTGTTNRDHMREDLGLLAIELPARDIDTLLRIGVD